MPWGARNIAVIDGVSIRLHWTDQPYRWHVNDGPEIFTLPDGHPGTRSRPFPSFDRLRIELIFGNGFGAPIYRSKLIPKKFPSQV